MRHLLSAVVIWLACAGLSFAQDLPDYAAWETTATRAETAVENARASDSALGVLRSEVAGWRSQFEVAQEVNAARLETVRNQLQVLGPAPEEGATEDPDIAARRADLGDQIQRLEAPQLTAREALSRADGIIDEIDTIVRARQQAEVLRWVPSPLIPANILSGLRDWQQSWVSLFDRVQQQVMSPAARQTARANLPLILFLLVGALVLVLRARDWSDRAATRISQAGSLSGRRLAGFVVSLGQIAGPVLGVALLLRALRLTDFYGPRGVILLDWLLPAAAVGFGALWLGQRVFAPNERGVLNLPDHWQGVARRMTAALGLTLGLRWIATAFAAIDTYDDVARAVIAFPFILVGAYFLYRLGQALSKTPFPVDEEGLPAPSVFDRLMVTLGRIARVLACLAPLAAAVGYVNAGAFLIYPPVLSLGLIFLLALLGDVVGDAYGFVTGGEGRGDALTPVLIGFGMIVVAMPVFALIWGVRATDLSEVWQTAVQGVTLGETRISAGSLLTLVGVFVLGYFLTRLLQSALRTSVLPKTQLDAGGRTALVAGIGYIGIFLAALIAISAAGINLASIALVAGALSVGIGFGLQNIVSNFVSGIILLIERPVSEGDWIEVGGTHGYVRNISVRSTQIETFDRSDVIVPNADLISNKVTNYTRGKSVGRVIVPVGVAYGTDTRRVEAILQDIAEAHPMVLLRPPPGVVFQGFGADSMDFEIRAILRDVNFSLSVRSDMNHEIAKRFAEEEIEIPFAQRDLWLRNPEALK